MYNLGDQFKRKQECGKANEKCIYKGNKLYWSDWNGSITVEYTKTTD